MLSLAPSLSAILWAALLLAVIVLTYALVLRPIIRQREWLPEFYDRADGFWARAALYLKGWRTIIISRLQVIAAFALAAHEAIAATVHHVWPHLSGFDWTPFSSRLLAPVPADMRPLVISLAIAAIWFIGGVVHEWLRRITDGPVGEKDV